MDPCLRGRVLVGGILFPLNKHRIKSGIGMHPRDARRLGLAQWSGSAAEGKVPVWEDRGPNSDLSPRGCVPEAQRLFPVRD